MKGVWWWAILYLAAPSGVSFTRTVAGGAAEPRHAFEQVQRHRPVTNGITPTMELRRGSTLFLMILFLGECRFNPLSPPGTTTRRSAEGVLELSDTLLKKKEKKKKSWTTELRDSRLHLSRLIDTNRWIRSSSRVARRRAEPHALFRSAHKLRTKAVLPDVLLCTTNDACKFHATFYNIYTQHIIQL